MSLETFGLYCQAFAVATGVVMIVSSRGRPDGPRYRTKMWPRFTYALQSPKVEFWGGILMVVTGLSVFAIRVIFG